MVSDRLFLDLAFQHVDAFVVLDDPVGQRGVAARQRVDGIVELLLGKAAHLGQQHLEGREVFVIGFHDMVGHLLSPVTQPKRPVM